jgi:glycosyltransferase involved in cell wall biosynthesis
LRPAIALRLQELLVVESAVAVILPVHNAERALRRTVMQILDLAVAAERRLTLAIVDDGSTDDTFEAASELARDFPQVRVFRQPLQGGLGRALDEVRRRLKLDEAIVHDGVGPIDLGELAAMLCGDATAGVGQAELPQAGRGSRRFAAVKALNARLAEAHGAIASLHWMKLAEPSRPRRRPAPLSPLSPAPVAWDDPIPLA